jgi:hypothetical protein
MNSLSGVGGITSYGSHPQPEISRFKRKCVTLVTCKMHKFRVVTKFHEEVDMHVNKSKEGSPYPGVSHPRATLGASPSRRR